MQKMNDINAEKLLQKIDEDMYFYERGEVLIYGEYKRLSGRKRRGFKPRPSEWDK